MKRRNFGLAALLVLVGLAGLAYLAGPAQAGSQDFTLVNKTGVVIDALYVVPNHARTWEDDVLGRDVLRSGESADISFSPKERHCVWDIMVVDKEGNEVWWEDIDLCQHQRIILKIEKGEPMAYFE